MLLGSVGLYGVVSYVTEQRTQEIGIRMALGARASSVQSMVMRQGLLVTGAGVVIGLVGALALSRFMEALLYGVSAADPLTFGAVSATLLAVSMMAIWIPARKAAGTNPMQALRQE